MASDTYAWIESEGALGALAQLDPALHKAAWAEDLQLRLMAHMLIDQGGKRLRPALLFLAGDLVSKPGRFDPDRLVSAATALELLHVASLYHDDVMDRASLRRHTPSANARWGNEMAALAGTFLFARAIALLAPLGTEANQIASQAAVDLCSGQMLEIENAYNLDLTETRHLEILERKTATLFELPCRLGAVLAGASPAHTEALARYGRSLGLAFQLVDDVLDLSGQIESMGKATGRDLYEGTYSLPVRRALLMPQNNHLRLLLRQANLNETEVDEAITIVQTSGMIESTMALARQYSAQASQALGVLSPGPARRSLERLTDYVISRSM